jgi:hypothetical protein
VCRATLIILIMIALPLAYRFLFVYPPTADPLAFRVAKAKWSLHPISAYHMTVRFAGDYGCQSEYIVRDERVAKVELIIVTPPWTTWCDTPTVTELFALLEDADLGTCMPVDECSCSGPYTLAEYDPSYGYPTFIEQNNGHAEESWRYFPFLSSEQNVCVLIGYGGPSIEIVLLTPLDS